MSTKFVKFQRPVDFDAKLGHVKRLLDDVDQQLHLVDLMSVSPDSVDTKLEQCTVSSRNPSYDFFSSTWTALSLTSKSQKFQLSMIALLMHICTLFLMMRLVDKLSAVNI